MGELGAQNFVLPSPSAPVLRGRGLREAKRTRWGVGRGSPWRITFYVSECKGYREIGESWCRTSQRKRIGVAPKPEESRAREIAHTMLYLTKDL